MSSEDDGFLSRWSRLKRIAQETPRQEPEVEVTPTQALESDPDIEPVGLTDEEIAALPRIEDLVEGADIKAFLRPGVPAVLKNAAMRRIWMLTPGIRDYSDPAVDYAWDWNTPGGVPGDGCAPTLERASQMMRDLFEPRQSEPSQGSKPELAEHDQIAQSEVVETSEGTIPEESVQALQSEEDADVSTSLPVTRRRHGGALPS